MKKFLLTLFGLALITCAQSDANAQSNRKLKGNGKRGSAQQKKYVQSSQSFKLLKHKPANKRGLPKVDFRAGPIRKLGQGLSISVTNQGTVMSPKSIVSVAVYDVKTRQLLMTKSLTLSAMRANQTSRVIFVPPQGKTIMVRAKVDPGNRVPELNERNNEIATRFQMP